MTFDPNILEKIDALHDEGRDFVERGQIHGVAVEYEFDTCRFDKWRRKANDLLFALGGCDDLYYQRFSKQVSRPHVKDLEVGLKILSAVRDDVSSTILRERTGKACPEKGCSRPSAGFD
jgi:hypothetical protein